MKAVLMSIHPKRCELIFSGEKTIEVRKTAPKLEMPYKVYVYETKGATETPWVDEDGHFIYKGCGQVVGEFVCDRVEKYEHFIPYDIDDELQYSISQDSLISTCLEPYELTEYGNGKPLRGLHITQPKLYDTPKELSEYRKPDEPFRTVEQVNGHAVFMDGYKRGKTLTRAPQSWCYVEEVVE